ncbi:hypothetical protein O181_019420 [Austropuccinia psidii MF-1]|uniref:Uncharacterized protein n=1 Tax=Austropuccinia psidii MF-1 TaxID=1389203 RepID=A0A9Q3CAK6_9BASI|nr:hypothetical protein [Austropuccinia psidii MF-1]
MCDSPYLSLKLAWSPHNYVLELKEPSKLLWPYRCSPNRQIQLARSAVFIELMSSNLTPTRSMERFNAFGYNLFKVSFPSRSLFSLSSYLVPFSSSTSLLNYPSLARETPILPYRIGLTFQNLST